MASFFDLKARKEAAKNGALSSKVPITKDKSTMQPWVEK